MSKDKTHCDRWIKLINDPNFGPIAILNWIDYKNKCRVPKKNDVKVLMDTGSIYLLSSNIIPQKRCDKKGKVPQGIKEYFFAGPSAKFIWALGSPILKSPDDSNAIAFKSCIIVGSILPDSVASLGIPGVIGLAPLPKHFSQDYRVSSFIDQIGAKSFWFKLKDPNNLAFRFNGKHSNKLGILTADIEIVPQITQPTPGLGFLTTRIKSLYVKFGQTEYTMFKFPADPKLAQSEQVRYEIKNNGIVIAGGIMEMIQWYCLFDTGTLPAVFHADAATNLLSLRVDNSILPGEENINNYQNADLVVFTFQTKSLGNVNISATNVVVPIITPDTFADRCEIFTVFGFSMMLGKNLHFTIDTSLGLPKSVDIYI